MQEHHDATESAPATTFPPLCVIGAGTMASAILDGAASGGVIDPDRVVVADPSEGRRARFARAEASASGAFDHLERLEADADRAGVVLLATKPQVFPEVAAEVAQRFASGERSRLVVSILAGTTTEAILKGLGPSARVVRVMPNTPAQVRQGMSAIAIHASATPDDLALVSRLFGAVGQTVELSEDLIDAFTGVAGSGPAYVFLLVEALAQAGESVGLSPEVAAKIARATVVGAGALLDADARPASELREAVTSKKGTTAAALDTFEAGDLRGLVKRAVTAARDRGRELGRA
ncbi:MAG: pyrroline-5-carboxylate reductase [Planctomycetota bacterium]